MFKRVASSVIVAAALVGCGSAPSRAEPDAAGYPNMPAENVTGPFPVTKVSDGDTIWVNDHGEPVKVRLIGIDTPELHDPRKPVECFAQEASNRAEAVLGGQTVYLETDPSQDSVDKYGRALAYVWTTSGQLFNLDMLADGFANEYTYDLPYRYQARFRKAEADARSNARGLWAPTSCSGQR